MIYFDNASTTRLSNAVYEKMCEAMKESFANPSSLHSLGFEVEKKIDEARQQLAKAIRAKADELYFTSGGTEANNTAVIGAAQAHIKTAKKVITSNIEHPSVADSFKELEKRGFEVVVLEADEKGYISLEELENAVDENTGLVSIMYVNNEVGTIQPIDKIYKIIKSKNPDCIYHCDCVQALGKHEINSAWFDMASFSGHKIHAPKGVGALYVKKGVRFLPLHYGGGQEKALRPGTENTFGIIAMGLAAEIAEKDRAKNYEKVSLVKQTLLNELRNKIQNIYVNGDEEKASPYILNISFEGVKGNVLLNGLNDRDIYVAVGSACSSYVKQKKKLVDYLHDGRGISAVRFSFDNDSTVDEARKAADETAKLVEMFRKFPPR